MPERREVNAPHIFVSYASVDRERVLPIVQALRDNGIDVWLDQDDIAGGTIYAAEIAAGIEGCRALALMCSPASLASHNVRQEIALAWKYRRPYLPLLLEPVTIPRDLEYWLEGAQWIELFDQPADDWLPRVIQAIDRIQGNSRAPAATVPYNAPLFDVPTPLTPIVGREDETREIAGLIDTSRLVTLTGPGGSGKTRLALAVAHTLRERFDGDVIFVDLSPVHDPALVISTIAGRLGIQSMGGQPIASALLQALSRRTVLLILDNLEQIVDTAAEFSPLLAGCPDLRILATSRTPLRLEGEQEYPIDPLGLPDVELDAGAETIGGSESVRMFVQRAQAVRPTFRLTEENAATIAAICVRLDGLPLAIELAAARVRMLSPEVLLQRLEHRLPLLIGGRRDLPARQQTLHNTIAWSHNLLETEDQVLFRQLGVFVGGWTLPAAEQVAGEDTDVLTGIDSLVGHSLVRVDETGEEPRFTILETVREFSLDQLVAAGEADKLRGRHAAWVLALIEEIGPQMRGARMIATMNRLDVEHANIRAALDWFTARQDADAGLRIVAQMWIFWWMRNHLQEGQQRINQLLALPREGVSAAALASSLTGAGVMAEWLNDLDTAERLQNEALRCWDEVPAAEQTGLFWPHASLANIAMRRGNYELSMTHNRAKEAIARASQDDFGLAMALSGLGNIEVSVGNLAGAEEIGRQALRHARASLDPWAISLTAGNLARVLATRGDLDAASVLLDEEIALSQKMGHVYQIMLGLVTRSSFALLRNRPGEALIDAQRATGLARRLGEAYHETSCVNAYGDALAQSGRLDEAMASYQESLQLAQPRSYHQASAEALRGIAKLLSVAGNMQGAVRAAAAATLLQNAAGVPLSEFDANSFEQWLATLRSTLPVAAFEVEWSAMMALPADEAIDHVLANS